MKTKTFCVLLAMCFVRCGGDRSPGACALYATAGLAVAVTNATTGQPICDAVVTASDGMHSEQLFENACTFVGAYERPGTYVIRAMRQGFLPHEVAAVRVAISSGECPHVEQARVTVPLTPGE